MASAPDHVPAAPRRAGSFCYVLRAIVPEMLTKRAGVALLRSPAILCTRSRPEQLPGRLPRWAWRRRRMAARRLTTITRHLSMLPSAPRVVGSWRRSPGTLRADADQGAGAGAAIWAGATSGGCECLHDCSMGGVGRVGTLMKPANHRSTGMRHSPRILPLGHMGHPRLNLTSQRAKSSKPISFEPLPLPCPSVFYSCPNKHCSRYQSSVWCLPSSSPVPT